MRRGFTPPVNTATIPAESLDEGDVILKEGREFEVLNTENVTGAKIRVQVLARATKIEGGMEFEPTECVSIKWHTLTGSVVPTAPCYRERDIQVEVERDYEIYK